MVYAGCVFLASLAHSAPKSPISRDGRIPTIEGLIPTAQLAMLSIPLHRYPNPTNETSPPILPPPSPHYPTPFLASPPSRPHSRPSSTPAFLSPLPPPRRSQR